MPTSTFFRLPEEKRRRLIDACWSELTRVRFTDVSINQIISMAHIPRGSFYQYFEDKDDLVRYLLEDMRKYFVALLREILIEAKGDLFTLPLLTYDRFLGRQGYKDPMLALFIKLLRLNQGIDLQNFMGGPQHFLPDPLWEVVDPARLRRQDREYADQIFHLACAVLAFAVVETLQGVAHTDRVREMTKMRMDLLRYGGAADGYEEVHT